MDQILSDRNVASINATLANLETISGGLADRDQGTQALLLSARDAARSLDTTLKTTNGTIERLDRNLVQQLPGIIDKLDATLASSTRPATPIRSLARTAPRSTASPTMASASWADADRTARPDPRPAPGQRPPRTTRALPAGPRRTEGVRTQMSPTTLPRLLLAASMVTLLGAAPSSAAARKPR